MRCMDKSTVIAHFGGSAKVAAALGISRQAVYGWPEIVPPRRQYEIERITDGALKADVNAEARLAHQADGGWFDGHEDGEYAATAIPKTEGAHAHCRCALSKPRQTNREE